MATADPVLARLDQQAQARLAVARRDHAAGQRALREAKTSGDRALRARAARLIKAARARAAQIAGSV